MGRSSKGRHERQFPVFKASVLQWYTPKNWDRVYPYLTGEKYSRRFIEHFTTEYARSHNCEYPMTDPFTGEVYNFNVYHSAQTVLSGVHKRHMDPFGRRNRNAANNGKFLHGFGDKKYLVSVCELVFFRWWLKNNVGDYVDKHADEIREDMAKMSRIKREASRPATVEEVIIELPEEMQVLARQQQEETKDETTLHETRLQVSTASDVVATDNPFHDEYWQASVDERMQQPKKRRKRYRESVVDMVMNNNCTITALS